jgi:hypothetical protein
LRHRHCPNLLVEGFAIQNWHGDFRPDALLKAFPIRDILP